MDIGIIGTGCFLPPNITNNVSLFSKINNFDKDKAVLSLEKKGVSTSSLKDEEIFDQWVQQVSGIKTRYYANDELKNSSFGPTEMMGYYAALKAIEDAEIDKNEIDTVIMASFTTKHLIPNGSISVAHLLGIEKTSGYIINTACSGFTDAVRAGYAHIAAGLSETVLVVASETMTDIVDWNDPTTAILFGDGAGAAILRKTNNPKDKLVAFSSRQKYSKEHITMEYSGLLHMDGGPNVQREAVNAMSSILNETLEKSGMNVNELDIVIPHQANIRILKQLASKLDYPFEKTAVSMDKIGNISCATIPVTLDLIRKNEIKYGYVKDKTTIGFTSVGGGYTFSSMISKM